MFSKLPKLIRYTLKYFFVCFATNCPQLILFSSVLIWCIFLLNITSNTFIKLFGIKETVSDHLETLEQLGAVHKWRHHFWGVCWPPPPPLVIIRHFLATPPPPLLCDDVIYEPKGVQSPIRWYLHYIRSSLAVCVYGCLPYEKWWRHLWTERRPIRWYLHYITLNITLH